MNGKYDIIDCIQPEHGQSDNSVLLVCDECDEPILPDHVKTVYDGEWCHLHCAAEAMDNADFDNWFVDRD